MQTRTLGDSDLAITPLGFGAWAIGGGGWAFGWSAQDDRASVVAAAARLVLSATDLEILAADPV